MKQLKDCVFFDTTFDKLLAESTLQDIEKALPDVLEKFDSPELLKLKEEFEKIKEDISSGDWGRIGVMAGMLWYKLDTLVQHLSTISNHLQNIERNTARIK